MVFNSLTFVAFFCVVYSLYLILPHRWQNRMLLLASYIFYGYWDWRFLGLILLSTVIDYATGLAIESARTNRNRKRFLAVSICTNLGILCLFKYANFFLDSLSRGLTTFGFDLDARIAGIVLPVGISFYTFQTMSYTIDIYRRELRPTRHFLDFALFVSFFPQLVAGPIERARVLLPQLTTPRKIRGEQFEEGCWLILSGYYLKCVLADNLAPFVERVFETPESVHGFEIIVGVWAAAFQIYGDFSGYSRIAIGTSKLMGIDLMQNFNRPYLATGPSDFWRRWHISLSTWLRDYLYIPLGGNRGSSFATYRNLMLTMVLGGLWHGAAWNFIFWGLFHGGMLCVWRWIEHAHQTWPLSPFFRTRFATPIRILLFFQLTCLGWLLFYAKDLSDLATLFNNCVSSFHFNGKIGLLTLFVFAGPVLIMEYCGERKREPHFVFSLPLILRIIVYASVTFILTSCSSDNANEFEYFQF